MFPNFYRRSVRQLGARVRRKIEKREKQEKVAGGAERRRQGQAERRRTSFWLRSRRKRSSKAHTVRKLCYTELATNSSRKKKTWASGPKRRPAAVGALVLRARRTRRGARLWLLRRRHAFFHRRLGGLPVG